MGKNNKQKTDYKKSEINYNYKKTFFITRFKL